jgi:hypothetical protein
LLSLFLFPSSHEYVPGSSPILELTPLMFLMIELRFHFARMSKSRSERKSKSKRKNKGAQLSEQALS